MITVVQNASARCFATLLVALTVAFVCSGLIGAFFAWMIERGVNALAPQGSQPARFGPNTFGGARRVS